MGLMELIIVLVVVGVILWLVNTYIPMEPGIKKLLNIAVIVFLVIWLLSHLGVLSKLGDVRV